VLLPGSTTPRIVRSNVVVISFCLFQEAWG
jgi:hypothetical protein